MIERKALFLRPVRVLVAGLHVLVHTGAFRPPVRHAELLTLIDERRALQKQIADGQHFAALHAILLAAVARNDARVIVIFEIQGIPAASIQLRLPAGKGTAQAL